MPPQDLWAQPRPRRPAYPAPSSPWIRRDGPSLSPHPSGCCPPPCQGSPFSSLGWRAQSPHRPRILSLQQAEPRALPGIRASCLHKATECPRPGPPRLSKWQQDRRERRNPHSHPSHCSSPDLRGHPDSSHSPPTPNHQPTPWAPLSKWMGLTTPHPSTDPEIEPLTVCSLWGSTVGPVRSQVSSCPSHACNLPRGS